ncbi:MAG: FAD-dependent oxidoreductase [Peptostreptococcaceae bacterium]|nr:FAD-dependent oxidoreductase [Peptostreptococcaceae bacterium]
MSLIRLNIDGVEVVGRKGQTILEIARENNIEIPTLCHDERVKQYGSCGLCVVEGVGMPKLMRSCSTEAMNDMILKTESKRVVEARTIALEMLMSDHTGDCQGPCVLACPGNTDCQAYVGLIANGQYELANKVIKDKLPLPASIGRVCPHPCETKCRRGLIEEPIQIASLKYFAGDKDLALETPYLPEMKAKTGKKVNIIGGGPGGLTAAYFLLVNGHDVTIYDQMPKLGGMLRYGIPQYRLPKSILQKEIDIIGMMGAKFVPNTKIGRDVSFEHIRNSADATLVAIGAWSSTKLGVKGEDNEGVLGGIEFLENYVTNRPFRAGERVAVVGGGNTAMDACRTSVRLGAKEVYNIYRRTKDQMPAEQIEIEEAEEEGVIFKELVNPIEIKKTDKGLEMILQVMELGEPDASGRRSPVPVEGKTETLVVDCVISAIGQILDPKGFEELELTKRGTIAADENTYATNIEGVFAIGDATNKGADIAIAAIGEAKRAVEVIGSYLDGAMVPYRPPFYSIIEGMTADDFEDRERSYRVKREHINAEIRKNNFEEVVINFNDEDARKEASRCLECGCMDLYECRLLKYSNEYHIRPERWAGQKHHRNIDDGHPLIDRNSDKCILCGLCVRTCEEVMGISALGLVHRGFETIVKPEMGSPLQNTGCIACGQCISVCPTGALQEKAAMRKQVQLVPTVTKTICSSCSVGCNLNVNTNSDLIIRIEGDKNSKVDNGNLCVNGKFSFDAFHNLNRIKKPLLKRGEKLEEATMESAFVETAKGLQSIVNLYGSDAVAFLVSDRYTNEDAYAIKTLANKIFGTENVYSLNSAPSALKEIAGIDASTASFDEMLSSELILVLGSDLMMNNTIIGIKVREAVKHGSKLVVINDKETILDEIAELSVIEETTDTLLQIQALVAEHVGKKIDMPDVEISEIAKEIAEMYLSAKTPMIVYNQNEASLETARIAGNIAAMTNNIGKARAGVIQLKQNANSQGLVDLGIKTDKAEFMEKLESGRIRALASFGEDVALDLSKLDLVVVQDAQMSEMAKKANVVLPGASFAETEGSFTSSERRIQKTVKTFKNSTVMENWAVAMEIARVLEPNFGFNSVREIQETISRTVKGYRGIATMDTHKVWEYEVNEFTFVPTTRAKLVDVQSNTSNAINHFAEYLSKNNVL